MGTPTPIRHRCDTCGHDFPPTVFVCPTCRTILIVPTARNKTPGWVIGLLVLLIVALAIYAAMLAYQVLVLHKY